MKKSTLAMLVTGVAMVVLGSGLAITAYAVSGGNIGVSWNNLSGGILQNAGFTGRIKTESKEIGAFRRLVIEADYGDITLIPSDNWSVEYAYFSDAPTPTVEEHDGTLTVKNTQWELNNNINLFGMPWANNQLFHKTYIRVYYPRATRLDHVDIKSSLGDLNAEELLVDGTFSLVQDMGNVEIQHLTAQQMTATLAMGSFDISEAVLAGVQVESAMGDIELQGDISGQITLVCSMGDIHFSTSHPRSEFSISTNSGAGDIELDGNLSRNILEFSRSTPSMLDARCAMGDISIWFDR